MDENMIDQLKLVIAYAQDNAGDEATRVAADNLAYELEMGRITFA